MRRRWAVFISGRGSLLRAVLRMRSQVDLKLVVSSRKRALGVWRAQESGIPVSFLSNFENWEMLHQHLLDQEIEFILLAGFMKIVPPEFLRLWENRVLNVHPSLLPNYKGLNALERSYEDVADMGATVHVVVPELDAGPIIVQQKVLDSSEIHSHSLEWARLRVHAAEQTLVQEAIRLWDLKWDLKWNLKEMS